MTALRIAGLTKRFGETVACADVTLDVPHGEILGVLGPSGCGKTTLLRCLAGFEALTSGEIWLEERLIASATHSTAPEKRRIGMVFQSYALWPHLTVAENVGMPLRLQGTPKADRGRTVTDALERLGLAGLARRYPAQLSGGQQQRVALARATVVQPQLLLLDEPLSNLDALLRARLRDELRVELKKLGITTVFVTHDQAEAMVICDRVALLSAGHLVQLARPRDLYERPLTLFAATFIGRANVLRGRVVGEEEDYTVVELGDGLRVMAVDPARLTAGTAVDVVMRPEHISPHSDGTDVNRIRARVTQSVFLGGRVECAVEAAGLRLRVELPGTARELAPGEELEFAVPRAKTLCFAADVAASA